jgi:hypothetical protein
MSWDKWILRDSDGAAFVAKRNERTEETVVGGHRRFRTQMERAIETGLGLLPPENTHSQRGRVRMTMHRVKNEQWQTAIRIWQDDWMAERVVRHGRKL